MHARADLVRVGSTDGGTGDDEFDDGGFAVVEAAIVGGLLAAVGVLWRIAGELSNDGRLLVSLLGVLVVFITAGVAAARLSDRQDRRRTFGAPPSH